MDEKTNMRYVDTSTASVKMTNGVPFTGSSISDSSIEDELENYDADSSPSETPSRRLETKPNGTGVRIDGRNRRIADNYGNSDMQGTISSQLLHKNERQLEKDSALSSRSRSPQGHLEHLKSGQNNNINQFISSDLSSSTHQPRTNISSNGTNSLTLNTGQITSLRSDREDKISVTGDYSGKLTTNIKKPDYNIRKTKGRLYSRPDKPYYDKSSKSIAISSTSSREQSQTERLSQSLENSQVTVLKQWEDGLASSNSMSAISNVGNKQNANPRPNPFNNDLLLDEEHFSDSYENYLRTDRHSTGSTKSSSVSQGVDWWQEQSDVSFAELGLSEDHFSHPHGHFGLSRAEELELAIENCKDLIREAAPDSDKQKNLVLKLVQLRIKLQEVKEGPEPVPDNVKVILSHKMLLKSSRTSKYYCERCNGAIWGMLQAWYRCTECGYRCHEKCLQQILRTCAKSKVLENPTLITEICPKESNGLAGQNYRCWECRLAISFKSGHTEPRLCDYTGRYYCEFCHWNDSFVIPARVLHSWDFTPQKVCRASKQFLKLMQKKAVIRIQDINPMLFVYVDQLIEIKKLREEMMIMKKYILSCASAMSAKLLLLLEKRQHFVESSDRYSMQDLLDAEKSLCSELVSVHSTWSQHIKVDCELCQGRGFCCEICGDKEILFPFDSTAVVCAKCSNVLHRHCFAKATICPRCQRRGKRQINSLQ